MFTIVQPVPSVCYTELWWLYPFCWGIPLMVPVVLAGIAAVTRRRVAAKR